MSGVIPRIDGHQHFWALARGDYGWLTPDLAPLCRDFLPHHLAPLLARLAAETNACCKLSGLVTEAGPDWTAADIAPYARHILGCFGPERTLWGSDWPVLNLAADYGSWSALVDDWLAEPDSALGLGLDAAARAMVRGGAAARFYRIEGPKSGVDSGASREVSA